MNLAIAVPLVGVPVTFACQVATCWMIRREGWDRAGGLVLGMAVLAIVSFAILPGEFSPGEDLANGLLLMLWTVHVFWFWVAAAACALLLHGTARELADRLRSPSDSESEIFE